MQLIAVIAEFLVQRVHRLRERHALRAVPCSHFAAEQRGVHRVLVADVRAGEIAIALLKAEEIALRLPRPFQLADLLADEFEARECAAQLNAVMRGDRVRHVGGNDGRHRHRTRGHRAVSAPPAAEVIEQQHAHLVAREQAVVPAVGHRRAHAVAVGVGAKQQIGARFAREREAALQRRALLGIRVGTGRKAPVGPRLLGHERHVRHADASQDLCHALAPRAVERRVDHAQRGSVAIPDAPALHRVEEGLQAVLADHADGSVRQRIGKAAQTHAVEMVRGPDVLRYGIRRLKRDLAAVGTVDLVAVVGGGVVARRNAHTRPASVIAHCPAQRGRRLQARIEIGGHAVGGKHTRGLAREARRADAAVVGNGAAQRQSRRLEVSGKSLRRAADNINIHAVRARAEHAAQSAGAEGKVTVKAVLDLRGVAHLVERGKLRAQRVILHAREPAAVSVQSGHRLPPAENFTLLLKHALPASSRRMDCKVRFFLLKW